MNCGDKVAVRGLLEEIPLPVNLGQFNERVYNYARGIKWYQDGESIKVLEKNFNPFLKCQDKIKEMWKNGISKVAPEDKNGFFESVLLGEKRNLDSSQKILFQIMGCSHILAISGLHLSILGGGILKVFAKVFYSFWGSRKHFHDYNDFIWKSYRKWSSCNAGGNYVFCMDWSADVEKNL